MKVSVQEKGSYKRLLSVEVEEEKVREKFDEILVNYKKDISIPGFRPGKVPKEIILRRFGRDLRTEAVEAMVQSSFKEACAGEKIVPISKPVISKLEAKEGAPLQYDAEFEVEPPVSIEDYGNLGVKMEAKPVSDADVEAVIRDLRERLSVLKTVDRPVKKGDFAELQYRRVVIGGAEKKDAQSPRYPVEIGAGSLTAFEDGIVGMRKGEEKTVEFSFPADYSVKDVAGKQAAFTVAVSEVKEKHLPALDDQFAKDVSQELKSLDELKKQVRIDLEAENRREAFDKACDAAIDKVIEKNPFEVPDSRVEEYLALSFENFKKQYPQAKATLQEFSGKNRDIVVRDFKKYRILDLVAQKENLKATAEETDEAIRGIAASRGEDFDALKAALRKDGRILDIRESIKERKVLAFLIGAPAAPPKA